MENTDIKVVEKLADSDTIKLGTGEKEPELKILEIKLIKLEDSDITKATQPEQKETEKNSNSSERNLEHADDEGEDLPENFFDDFSNKDFMAGLDIVDDWIDDGTPYFADDMDHKDVKPSKKSPPCAKKSKRPPPRSRRSRSHHRSRRSRSRDRDPKHRSSRNRDTHVKTDPKERGEKGSKERGEAGKNRRSKDRKRSTEKDAEGDDARRDPEKTKRDIQRDKIRFTKDQEQKVFIEQLKVAETGLVPPGTELDVVLESERKKKEDKKHEERKPDTKTRPVDERKRPHGKSPVKKTRSKSRGREARRTSRERRRESRERRRSRPLRSRSRRRSRESPRRRSRESPRRLSPLRRRLNRSRSYSPKALRSRRSRSLEELYRRNDDLRLRIREKRRERYINDLSPVSEPRLSRSPTRLSPISYVSEREVWLRNKYRSRYGRSCSPISSSSLSDHGSPRRKRSKKSSFMEEIQRKLRDQPGGDKTSFNVLSTPFKNILPVPAPTYPYVPPFQNNQMFPPAPQMCPNPYQQPQLQPLMAQPCMPPQMMPMPNTMQEYGGQMVGGPPMGMTPPPNMGTVINLHQKPMQLPGPPKPVQHPSKMGTTQHLIQKPAQLYGKPDENKELTKLFEEQKISLSDYLSVSAKPIDPKAPINVHVKVKAISKCQEVIRVINERSKHNGRFFPKMSTTTTEKPTEIVKWKSPLRKVFPMRFNFTTQSKKPTTVPESNLLLINKLLAISGLPRLTDVQTSLPEESPKKQAPAPISMRLHTPAKQIPIIQSPIPPAPKPPVLIKRISIGVQTDPIKCQICELRKSMQFDDHACQTVPQQTLDECTQVCVEDLNKSCVTFTPRGILKNSSPSVQSISHLTPAQLLQMQREKEDLDNPWGCGDTWNDSPYSRFSDQDPRSQFKSSGLSGNSSFNSKDLNDPRGFKSSGLSGNSSFNTKEDPRTFKTSGLSGNSIFNTNEDPRSFKSSGLTGSNFISNPNRNLRESFLNVNSNTNFNKSSFGVDKLPFSGGLLDRPFSLSSSFDRGGESFSGGDRFGGFGNDRYSPEQNFSDSSNFTASNSSRGRGSMAGRGFSNAGSFSAPNRPFYGSRGGHN